MSTTFVKNVQSNAKLTNKWIIAVTTVFVVCVVVSVVLILTSGRNLEARVLEIFSVDGPVVYISRGTSATVSASAGARLHDGYSVSTGRYSICHIRLDIYSLVRMDSNSRISVNRTSATVLSILVDDGQILIDVQNQYEDHELEVMVGNSTLGVRGTLFIVRCYGAEEARVIMLEGSVYAVGYESVSAGYVMTLRGDELPDASPLRVEELDSFALQAILDYSERVLRAGAITIDELEWIISRMNVPEYIWIQDLQISTASTELHLTSDTVFADVSAENIHVVNLTNEDILPLAYLINLRHLTLNRQNISDITPLAELANLSYLWISANPFTDWTPVDHVREVHGRP